MAGDCWMKVVQAWHIIWAFVRRVRLSSWKRISSQISAIEKACDPADLDIGSNTRGRVSRRVGYLSGMSVCLASGCL
jgi:hypothetical protein